MEEANNVKMASFLIFTFASSSPCLLHIFYEEKLNSKRLWPTASSDGSILRFFLCQSLFQCIAAGVEKFMKESSDDAILVFPLLCPPPSCHNTEFQKGKMLERAATSRQASTTYYIQ